MKGYKTTFVGLFATAASEHPEITAIEIPIIQRDFAQGREDDDTSGIRERFVGAIVDATTGDPMGLDFVYGDIRDGVLRPLDGQQRLTTLFLLHWYVASLAGVLDATSPWLRFSYATRPSARDFCEILAENPFPGGVTPKAWIEDQPWYLYPWQQDPTITSMLVMLDELHDQLQSAAWDPHSTWTRLTSVDNPAIWFLFLPVADMDRGEDLYIKMNSRGKPLTDFEVIKADLERQLAPTLKELPCPIEGHDHSLYTHLTWSIDNDWTDLLWEYEKASGGDFRVDDEFERYLRFIIDVCEWRDGQPERRWRDKRERPLAERAKLALVDRANVNADRNREFFFHAFDTWVRASPATELTQLFTAGGAGAGDLPLFASSTPDLLASCIAKYGTERDFSVAETLLLFGVLLTRQVGDTVAAEDKARRLRSLRNLTAAFLDSGRMVDYIAATHDLIVDGSLDAMRGFRQEWMRDEVLKWEQMTAYPQVTEHFHDIEDNPLVRGRLHAFDILNPDAIEARAESFNLVSGSPERDLFGAALLTKGDYSRDVGRMRRQLGSSQKDDSWTDLLTTGSRDDLVLIREPLMALLDDVTVRRSVTGLPASQLLRAICDEWLEQCEAEKRFDWRYYFVRYPSARSSKGDGYFENAGYQADAGGFSYSRLNMLYGKDYNGHYSDVFLRAAWMAGPLSEWTEEPRWRWSYDRGIALKNSRIEVRCEDDGFELVVPEDEAPPAKTISAALESFARDAEGRVVVLQEPRDGRLIDAEDRVQLCIRLVQSLAAAGL